MSNRSRAPKNLAALKVEPTDGDLEKLDAAAFGLEAMAGYRYPEGAEHGGWPPSAPVECEAGGATHPVPADETPHQETEKHQGWKDFNIMSNVAGSVSAAAGRTLFLRVAVLCAMVAFFDGVDSVSMGPAGPAILETLRLAPNRLGPVVSAALLGAVIGAFSFGNLGDRFGRKRMLLAATLVFGLLTLATAYATSFGELILIRFIAGLGLGGATPCFIAIATEYTPREHRARVTSTIWTAFPVGNVVGTLFAAFLLAKFSWRAIFIFGGVLPLLVFLALLIWLPETRRIAAPLPGADAVAATEDGHSRRASYRTLFMADTAVDTVLLWVAFLSVFGVVAAVFYFAPQLMHAHGIPLKVAALVLGLGGVGSLIGSPAAGYLIERFGAGVVMATTLILGAVGTSAVGYVSGSVPAMMATLAFLGVFVSGMGISGVLALAAIIYPASIRSTGVGGAVGSGRFGQVVMPLVISGMQTVGVTPPHLFLFIAPLLLLGAAAIVVLTQRQQRTDPVMPRFAASS